MLESPILEDDVEPSVAALPVRDGLLGDPYQIGIGQLLPGVLQALLQQGELQLSEIHMVKLRSISVLS